MAGGPDGWTPVQAEWPGRSGCRRASRSPGLHRGATCGRTFERCEFLDRAYRGGTARSPPKEEAMPRRMTASSPSSPRSASRPRPSLGRPSPDRAASAASRLDDGKDLLPQATITEAQAIDGRARPASGGLNEVDLEHGDGRLVFNVDVGSTTSRSTRPTGGSSPSTPTTDYAQALTPGVPAVRLLLVEDDAKLARALARGLRHEGYAVDVARPTATRRWCRRPSGTTTRSCSTSCCPAATASRSARALRERGCWAPVLMLTARGAGPRPHPRPGRRRRRLPRQAVRVRRAARAPARAAAPRAGASGPRGWRSATSSSTPRTREVTRAGAPVELTAREFAVLEYLARHAGEAVTRTRAARARLGRELRAARRTSSTSTSATCAGSSSGRSAGR